MPEPSPLIADILRVLGSGPIEGLRGAELRPLLAGPPEVPVMIAALDALRAQGSVERDHNGRWSVPASRRATIPPAPSSTAGRRAGPATPPAPPAGLARLPEAPDIGIPPRAPDGSFQLDDTQRPVAHAPPEARQIVEAGPGHGKTAVACARVAHLLEEGVPGSQILLLSFTRTAVRELRQRIRELSQSGADVAEIQILTIDSWASRLRSGFLGVTATSGGFTQGIVAALGLLRAPTGDLATRLEDLRHVLIDEAQDLVGPRAELIAQLLASVSERCGFTVFLDPAQGIYDWAEDGSAEGEPTASFSELLCRIPDVLPTRSLGHLHRTADPDLRRLLLGARMLVLNEETSQRATVLRGILAQDLHQGWPDWKKLVPTLPEDALVLFRRRGAALDASAWLASAGIPHRLRLGGMPQPVAPWVAALLLDTLEIAGDTHLLSGADAEQAWAGLDGSYLARGWTFAQAWRALRRMAAERGNRIDARKVADALLGGRTPDDLFTRELGPSGPVLGTVHGSKGREGSRVVFVVPAIEDWRYDDEEQDLRDAAEASEARVLYVAITRAKERLDLYDGGRGFWFKVNGRDWKAGRKKDLYRFEIGREGDIDTASALAIHADRLDEHQRWLRDFDGRSRPLIALKEGEGAQAPWLVSDPSQPDPASGSRSPIAVLQGRVLKDIREALERRSRWHADGQIHHLYLVDITTTAIPAEHPALDRLPEPWRTLRLILAPVVVGLGSTYARRSDR